MREIAFVMGGRKKPKSAKQLERHLKGVSNHRRIEILLLVDKNGAMTLDQIAAYLDCHMTTTSEHAAKLTRAGLVSKSHRGRYVEHELSPYGKSFVKFLKMFGSL